MKMNEVIDIVFIARFEQVAHVVPVFSLFTLNKYIPYGESAVILKTT